MSSVAEEPSQSGGGGVTGPVLPPDTQPGTPTESSTEDLPAEDLMLRWEDHHKSFFELAEDLCHQEQFIDVTISCGDHNFPAHKLILSVCSPYFKNLFLRNPCKHPIVVLKDVHFKYMKLLLIFMYRGEVAVPQEDLPGLLKVARSLQVRGLAEMSSPGHVSPRKRYLSEMMADSDLESREGEEFSIDEVKSRLHGQLEIQAVASPLSTCRTPPLSSWLTERAKYLPTSSSRYSDTSDLAIPPGPRSSRSESGPSEDEPHSQFASCKREVPDSWAVSDNGSDDPKEKERMGDDLMQDYQALLKRETRERSLDSAPKKPKSEPAYDQPLSLKREYDLKEETRGRQTSGTSPGVPTSSSLLDAARAAGLDIPPSNSDPMSSISALLAAAQATGGIPVIASSSATTTSATTTSSLSSTKNPSSPATLNIKPLSAGPSQGLDLSNPAAAMANVNAQMQLYYYMQKLQTAGMGNPKERKECPICGKTLYDRSTWNRHMRIHTGEKPYPCSFCGRRFRTNYNKIGHEKKCPDRHARAILQPAGSTGLPAEPSPGVVPNIVYR